MSIRPIACIYYIYRISLMKFAGRRCKVPLKKLVHKLSFGVEKVEDIVVSRRQ